MSLPLEEVEEVYQKTIESAALALPTYLYTDLLDYTLDGRFHYYRTGSLEPFAAQCHQWHTLKTKDKQVSGK